MRGKRWLILGMAVCLTALLCGCGDSNAVYVQSVEALSNMPGV